MNYGKEFTKGLIRENPTLVSLLGMCPTLAVTTGAFHGIRSDFLQLGHQPAAESHSGTGQAALLYRHHCNICNFDSIFAARFCSGTVHKSGCISGTDYRKLYHFRTSGNVCQQEHPAAVYPRWCWHGIGLYTCPVPDGLDSRNLRLWQLVRAVHSVHAGTHHVTIRHAGRRFLCAGHYHCRCLPSFQEKATEKNRMQCLPECGCLPGCKL